MARMTLVWAGGAHTEATVDDDPLGRGGEGTVHHAVADTPVPGARGPLVVKRYHDAVLAATPERLEKLAAMVLQRPDSDALCWPLALAVEHGRPVGFAMAAVDTARAVTWAKLANPADRRRTAPGFSFRYALRTVANLAAGLDAAHRAGAVLGDVNESNVLVADDGTVTVIDCDSAQLAAPGGTVWRCLVGKPEYTAAELVGNRFADVDRTPSSDTFAFAVLAFQMLAGGAHPFDGVPADLDTDLPPMPERIKRGLCPYLGGGAGIISPAPRVAAGALPSRLAGLFAASLLAPDPSRRPPLSAWWSAIAEIEQHLVDCDVGGHSFDKRDGTCGWCTHAAATGLDPWAGTGELTQAPLPPLTFRSAAPAAAAAFTPAAPPQPTHPAVGTAAGAPAAAPPAAAAGAAAAAAPAVTYSSTLEYILRHPVCAWRYALSRIPARDKVGSGWIRSKLQAVPPATPAQSCIRWAVAVAGWAAAQAVLLWFAMPAALELAGVPATALPAATRAVRAVAACGAVVATAAFLTGIARQARWRLWRGFQWGDAVRLPAMAVIGALAAPLSLIGCAVAVLLAAARASTSRS